MSHEGNTGVSPGRTVGVLAGGAQPTRRAGAPGWAQVGESRRNSAEEDKGDGSDVEQGSQCDREHEEEGKLGRRC
jgi:hypothetical protein